MCIALFASIHNALSQGFVDLNFENATIVPDTSSPYYPYAVYANSAIPGWTVSGITFLPTNEILYNTLSTGSSSVSLLSTNAPFGNGALVIAGEYSINLYNNVSISQTGQVPVGTDSILFKASGNMSLGLLLLSLGGENISFAPVSTGSNFTLYGGNIPTVFDGLSEQLSFSVAAGQSSAWTIDDIQFSPSVVPEPSVFGLSALGVALFGFCRRKN